MSETQLRCPVCSDLFTDPVTTPCGHNFCKTCISQHWDSNVLYDCPLCKEQFSSRPQLRINTSSKEMVDQFRHKAQQSAGPGEVPCDVCTGPKMKAQESLCSVLDHKTHEFVPLREECEGKKAELRNTKAEVQQIIQNRRLKIQEIKESLRISEAAADRETAEGLQVFTDLMDSVERAKKSFMKEMEDKQKTTKKQAEDFIKDLDQEISELMKRSSELMKRSSELKKLSESKENLFLNFSSLKPAPPTTNWTQVRVDPPSYEGSVVRAVAQLEEDLRKKMKKMESKAELKRVQRFEVDLTLDPKTAHPKLFLSADRKQVHHRDVKNDVPDNQERFSDCACVLGSQSFSSGRFYFQVQVKEKTNWFLGVARKSIIRKGHITVSPQKGFWAVVLRNRNQYKAAADPPVNLSLQSGPEKVGVFVDYQEGLVSFYDVDAAALIYSFTGCCFNEDLYPFFCPDPNFGGKNSSPLIICPVNQSA